MTLRQQVRSICASRINEAYTDATSICQWLDALAAKAFVEQWPESLQTRAIRRAYRLLHEQGFIDLEEPSLTDESPELTRDLQIDLKSFMVWGNQTVGTIVARLVTAGIVTLSADWELTPAGKAACARYSIHAL